MPNCRIFNSFLHSLAAICGRHHFRYDYYEKHFLIMVIIFLVPPKKQAVVIGSEGRGISQEALARCEKTIRIPMRERCESLNAAAAATVVLWEMARGH